MTTEAARIAAACEEIVLDTHLAQVRAWRERTGHKAVGHLPVYAPRELIDAAGMLPVAIFGGGDQVEIIRGDAYFQSYICQLPRSVIEMGLTGRLDVLDGMLFPATCDVIRNLSGMWQLLFPEKLVAYVDLPHDHRRGVGGRFYAEELRRIGADLGRLSGIAPTPARLRASIEAFDANRRAIGDLYDLRSRAPHLCPTSEVYVVIRAGAQLPVEEHTTLLRRYHEAALSSHRPLRDCSRVVVVGSFCEQPPLGLLKVLERAGCYVVDDDLLLGLRYLTRDVEDREDPYQALADAYLEHGALTASRYQPGEEKGRWLVDRCRQRGAEGVIFAAASFCDPALLEQPMLQAALDREGIPYTAFKFAENTAQLQPIHEQAGTFSDSIKLWSDA